MFAYFTAIISTFASTNRTTLEATKFKTNKPLFTTDKTTLVSANCDAYCPSIANSAKTSGYTSLLLFCWGDVHRSILFRSFGINSSSRVVCHSLESRFIIRDDNKSRDGELEYHFFFSTTTRADE